MNAPDKLCARLAIIGVGMIGGSLALALKSRNAVDVIIGAGRARDNLQLAQQLGAIDEIADTAADAVARADVVVLAAPVGVTGELFDEIKSHVDARAVITDVGSVKAPICAQASRLGARHSRFVPGHPVAGKEKSGVRFAAPELFVNHSVALTPTAHTDIDAVALVSKMWRAVGASVHVMDAGLHDHVLALTSHLPHVLAYAMVDVFAAAPEVEFARDMSAGGFYDFTRTASSDAALWRDVCLMNREPLLARLDSFTDTLARLRRMIDHADGDALDRVFTAAKQTRRRIAERRKGA